MTTPATQAPDLSDHTTDHARDHNHAAASAEALQAAVSMADAYCRERGQKLTPIRRTVLELLLASGRATKAYTLLDEMRAMHPNASPPTVYRALDFLLSAGLIHRIESINAFTVCHDLTHCQHGVLVVCQKCGRVTELPQQKQLRQSLVAQVEASGYRLTGDDIELKGVCPACQAAEDPAAHLHDQAVRNPGH